MKIKNLFVVVVFIGLTGCASVSKVELLANNQMRQMDEIRELNRELNRELSKKDKEIKSLSAKINELEDKLKGVRFIVNENTIQIDSENGYPIPSEYHRNNTQ